MNEPGRDWPQRLLRWYRAHARELPWREERNPYRTWVSEVMLQQTKVEAARAYYTNWLEKFPTPQAVAAADESEVLHAWQGLGYYSRARNLQRAMREVAADYDGEIPADEAALRALPGVGPYMAGAILSLAFNRPVPAVDGNVLRVISRLYGRDDDIMKAKARREVTALVAKIMPQDEPGAFNEALMDLGATVCIPKAPRCEACPLRADCVAYKTGRTRELPVRIVRTKQQLRYVAVAVWERDGAYLLRKRPARGLLASMWEFPSGEGETAAAARADLTAKWAPELGETCWERRHVFSHRIWEMCARRATALRPPEKEEIGMFGAAELLKLPLAGPHARLAAALLRKE